MNSYLLLILLFVCHWLADFSWLSTKWMLDAKAKGSPWYPILVHSFVHGTLMGIVLLFCLYPNIIISYLILFQVGSHFLIDVWKGKMNVWFPVLQNDKNKLHWVVMGFDQLLHGIVIITMVWFIYGK